MNFLIKIYSHSLLACGFYQFPLKYHIALNTTQHSIEREGKEELIGDGKRREMKLEVRKVNRKEIEIRMHA